MGLMARLIAAAINGLSGAKEALDRAFVRGDVSESTMKKVARQAERARLNDKLAMLSGNRPWRGVLKRKAAPSSGTRQNERRAWFESACKTISENYGGEPRATRRRMARAMGKRQWRKEQGLPENFARVTRFGRRWPDERREPVEAWQGAAPTTDGRLAWGAHG